jgi:hypothetical protein
MDSRQERYRRRLIFKAGWFETTDARRQVQIRAQIAELRSQGPVCPEQEALFPFFLSHPLAKDLVEIGWEEGCWQGWGNQFHATLAAVALDSASSAPAAFHYVTNSGSGVVGKADFLYREIQKTVAELKALGLWVAE